MREARLAAGLTQEALGFELGVSKSSVSAWENGRESPSFRLLPDLGRLLGRSLDELLSGTLSAREKTTSSEKNAMQGDAAARDEKERTLLLRYRRLPTAKRGALLELIKPE